MSLAEFGAMTPHIDWARYLREQGAKNVTVVNVRTPGFFHGIDSLIAATPVEDWKAYLRWHVTNGAMASLGSPFRREAFRRQQVTTGLQQQQPRMKQCASAMNAALGEAVGQEWVKRNFSPEAKARAAKVAYFAMEKALGNKPRRKIDGFTPEQRFFLAWAQIWRGLERPEAELQSLKTNPHSPGKWRVNGPLSNMPEFAKAWGCKEGDPMVRSDSLRARIL